jgi:cystathionine beta-lyase/cystathionine gamma-synthase
VSVDDLYPGSDALFAIASGRGIEVEYADLSEPDGLARALDRPELGMVWIETPTNPLLKVVDIAEAARLAHERGALVLVDNTFASPYLQQPLALGADLTLYSTTKSIAGHGDVFGGALVYRDPALDEAIRAYRTAAGNIPGPLDCFLVHRGLKTLALRVDRQVHTTRRVVDLLRRSPVVSGIRYPGMAEHPQYPTAKAQMSAPGSIVSFEYHGGPPDELLDRVRLFAVGVSLGAVHSLIECPALMTHRPLPAEVRARRGITDSLVRLSIGIEDPDDILDDLRQALLSGAGPWAGAQ